ncbi:MAG TPA: hypothetical protein PKI14_01495 [Fervidobacterium sp.]|nr:hypothetical protein [Fervidobacterium sp.]
MSRVVEHLISNRDYYLKYAQAVSKRLEIAEDLIQASLLRLLKSGIGSDGIKDIERFTKSTIRQVYANYKKVNRRYVRIPIILNEDGRWVEVEFEDPDVLVFNIDEYSMKMIIKKARATEALSSKEMATIERCLRNENVDSKTAKYETFKTHKRNAIIKMRDKFVVKQGEKRD